MGEIFDIGLSCGSGWFPIERAEGGAFCWMSTQATIEITDAKPTDTLTIEYEYPRDLPPTSLWIDDTPVPIFGGYNYVLLSIDQLADRKKINLNITRLGAFSDDHRALGLKVHKICIDKDPVSVNTKKTVMSIRSKAEICDNNPLVYMIGVTDRCNLRCVICLKHHKQQGDNNANLTDISDVSLQKMMPLAYTAQMVLLLGYGEPFLNPRLPEIIDEISSQASNSIEMITNGLLLNKQWIDKILSRNVRVLSISMDAATPEGYKKMRGGSYEKVIRNVQALVAERSRRADVNIEIRMNMAVTRYNIAEVPLLVELAADLGVDTVEFRHLHENELHAWRVEKPDFVFDYNEALIENDPDECRNALTEAIHRAKRRNVRYILDAPFVGLVDDSLIIAEDVETGAYSDCPHPWRWLMITAEGDAYTCCWAPPIAKLSDYASAADLWNGNEYRRLRRNIKNGIVDNVCSGVTCPFQQAKP